MNDYPRRLLKIKIKDDNLNCFEKINLIKLFIFYSVENGKKKREKCILGYIQQQQKMMSVSNFSICHKIIQA